MPNVNIAKVVFKENASATPEVWMDTTQKTVTSGSMLSGTTALKNDGTDITGSIATKTSSDMTASGATVTAPAGYYASDASKSVAAGSATTPETTITVEPWISINQNTGVVSAGVSQGSDITPTVVAGYVSSGTAGSVTASGSSTMQLNTQSATYFHPSTTDQTISNGKYLTGIQTFCAVEHNLTADKIASGFVAKIGDWEDDDCVASITGTHSVVPNLTDKTVTPSTETQIVMKDTDTGSIITASLSVASRTSGAGGNTTSGGEFSPSYTPTDNASYRLIGQISAVDSSNNVLESYDIDGVFIWNTSYQTIAINGDNAYIRTVEVKKSGSTTYYLRFIFGQTASFGIQVSLKLYSVNTSYDGLDIVTVNPISLAPAKSASPNANYDVPILPGTETLAAEFPIGVLPAWNVSSSTSGWASATPFAVVAGFTSGNTYFVTGEAYVRNYTTGAPIGTISIRGYWDATTSRSDLPVTFSSTGVSDVFDMVCAYFMSSGACYLQGHYLQPGRLQFTQPLRFYSLSNVYNGLVYGTANKPQLVNKVITGTTSGVQYVLPNTSTLVSSKTMGAITKNGEGVATSSSAIVDSGVLTTGNMYRITFVAEYSKDDVSIGTINVNEDIYIDGSTNIYLNLNREPDDGTIAISHLYYCQANTYMYLTFVGTGSHRLTFLAPVNFYTMSGNNVGLSSVCVLPAQVPYSETLMKNYIQRSSTFTDITWPEGLTNIGYYAFAYCTNFNPSSLPSGVKYINDYAFYACSNLALTSLPSGVTAIGSYAFYSCTNLALTSLPSGVTNIGSYAFYGCTSLALASLPSGITNIGSYAFYGCTSLALASLPSGITSIGQYAFYNCTELALTSLPSGVTNINSYAFKSCNGITTISCNSAIATLGSYAFQGDSSYPMQLAFVSFPNMTVSSLGTVFGSTTAANACHLLAFADIGSTQQIAANAFANCYALQTLVLRRTSAICSLSNVSAFLNTPLRGYNSLTAEVYVPNDLISTYQSATNWSTLYNDGTITFKKIEGSDYDLS